MHEQTFKSEKEKKKEILGIYFSWINSVYPRARTKCLESRSGTTPPSLTANQNSSELFNLMRPTDLLGLHYYERRIIDPFKTKDVMNAVSLFWVLLRHRAGPPSEAALTLQQAEWICWESNLKL